MKPFSKTLLIIFVVTILLATKCVGEEDYLLVNNQTNDTLYVVPELILEDTLRPFKYRLMDNYVIYPLTKKRMFDFPLMALKEAKYWNEIVKSDTAKIFVLNSHFRSKVLNNNNYEKCLIKEYKLVIEDVQNKDFVLSINLDK